MLRYKTGFKFIGNKAKELESEGYSVPFGYEEAIGYMIGTEIRDKDGVAATVRPTGLLGDAMLTASKICFADLAIFLASQKLTVSTYLRQLYEK